MVVERWEIDTMRDEIDDLKQAVVDLAAMRSDMALVKKALVVLLQGNPLTHPEKDDLIRALQGE